MSNKKYDELTPEELAAAKASRARWAREYRARNPEANKRAIRRYWAKRAAREAAESEAGEDG